MIINLNQTPSKFVPRCSKANNEKYSNRKKVLNMLKNVIIPYIEGQCRITLSLDFDHPALLIVDVCKGQMTCSIKKLLSENHILLEKVPANLTYLF